MNNFTLLVGALALIVCTVLVVQNDVELSCKEIGSYQFYFSDVTLTCSK
jgi:hypothetical protein